MKHSIQAIAIAVATTIFAPGAFASTVTFEDFPGGVPRDGQGITNQFAATAGVTFGLKDGTTGEYLTTGPRLAQVGGRRTAFVGFSNGNDTIDPGSVEQVGRFFLTDDGRTSGGLRNPILVATYNFASAFISADILDVGSASVFDIRFYDATTGGNLLNTISITGGDPNTGNGVATRVEYDNGTAEILRVEIEGRNVIQVPFLGVGFDNFTSDFVAGQNLPAPVPLPASAWLLISGVIGVRTFGRRRSGLA